MWRLNLGGAQFGVDCIDEDSNEHAITDTISSTQLIARVESFCLPAITLFTFCNLFLHNQEKKVQSYRLYLIDNRLYYFNVPELMVAC